MEGDSSKDGLLSQDQEELGERVSYLEKKVRQQEDDIVCLKSALADAIRRINTLEAGRVIQNNVIPSKTNQRSPKKTFDRPRSMHLSALDNAHITPQKSSYSSSSPRVRSSSNSSTPLKKWSSMSASVDISSKSQNIDPSAKEPMWNQEDGYLKIYLKGRPVTLYAPTDVPDVDTTKTGPEPAEKLQLEWVYGYRGRDCRNNLYYLPTGEMVYFVASAVVLYNVEEHMQRQYLGHTDDVKCLAIHPDKIRIATGQVAGHDKKEGKPHVRIWDSVSLNTLNVIGIGFFDRAVACLSFSKLDGGQHLVAVDDANEHVISVWDLSRDKAHKIAETKSSTEPVLAVDYHPYENNSIVSCGKSHIAFWSLEGGTLNKKMGIFEKHPKPKYVLCLEFADNGDVLTGDSNGNIFIWAKGTNKISEAISEPHEGGVFSLLVLKDGTILSGGGKDRKVIQFDSSYKRTGIESELPEEYGPVRTLSQGKGNLILVGTTRNCILQGTMDLKFNIAVQGHTDELWGVASHPKQHQFFTCGNDKHVYLWDSMSHSVVWSRELENEAHCCCFHPDGSLVAIGTTKNRWMVIDLNTHETIHSHSDGNEQIECIEYSPDGNYLAIGSRDNFVYIYHVTESGTKYSKAGRCSGHSSFITHLDWSTDSKYLMTNSGDYEVLCWSLNGKQVTTPTTIKDVKWHTQNCTLSFNTAGIWPEGADGTDVNSCAKSHKENLLVSADDFGKVNLYQYPCCQPKSASKAYGGHSSHVTNVSFLFDDSRLITTGGKDTAVLQWEIM